MKAVILKEFGGPEQLVIEEIENPEPGPGEVRVRLRAIGLNRTDVAIRVGKYPLPGSLPVRLGMEGAGVVDRLGEGVTEFSLGQRVAVIPLGGEFARRGTCAEYANFPVDSLAPTPDCLTDEEAAATWMSYLTIWTGLAHQAQLPRGSTVIVTAASSSLGPATFQFLKHQGMTSIACTRSTEKVERLRELEPNHVIDVSREDLTEAVMRITEGAGANAAFDCVGGPEIKKIISAMAPNGKIILYGMLDSRPMDITPMSLMSKQITVYSHMIFNSLKDLQVRRKAVKYVNEGIVSRAFKPIISRVFPFCEIADAHRFMQSNQQVGKIVISVP